MKHATVTPRDEVSVTLTREQYADLMDTLDAIAGDLEGLTRLEAVVNAFRDQGCLHMPLGEILRELDDSTAPKAAWRVQAKYKQEDLAGLIAHLRTTLAGSRGEDRLSPHCAA